MARRTFHEEPISRLAAWSNRLALFALVVAALSVGIVRSNALEMAPALATFGAALVFAGLAVVLALLSFVVIWRNGLAGFGRALSGMFLGFALLSYPGYLGYRAFNTPALSDISTDPGNPPRFEALASARTGANTLPPAVSAERQQAAYPDIAPLQLAAVSPKVAYDVSLAVITKRKWQVANARAPAVGRRDSLIEATVRSTIMGFRDDIAVRVTPFGQGSRIDLRSASRYGSHDIGANAIRIRALLEEIEDAASAAPDPRPAEQPRVEPDKKPAPKRPTDKKPAEKRQPANR